MREFQAGGSDTFMFLIKMIPVAAEWLMHYRLKGQEGRQGNH